MAERQDILAETRERRSTLLRVTKESHSTISDLGDLELSTVKNTQELESRVNEKKNKLQQARSEIEKLPKELGDLTAGLEQELINIGYTVQEARSFTAWERFLLFIGQKDSAEKSRLERLENQRVDITVEQINKLTLGTVRELGEIEKDCEKAVDDFSGGIKMETGKLEEAQPKYEKIKTKRGEIEAARDDLKRELEAGTVSASERPEKEKELDELEKTFHKLHLVESDLLIVIKVAQEAIDILQKNRTALLELVKSIHGMRRQLLEKQEAFKSILENCMTTVKAGAKIERFNAVDPTVNKVVSLLTNVNVAVAAGGMETLADRLSKSSMDPDEALRLSQKLAEETSVFMEKLAEIAEEVEKGGARVSRRKENDNDHKMPNGKIEEL